MADVIMLIHQEKNSYGASFPDFPGATTVAGDYNTLVAKAEEMLRFHISGMAEDGEEMPRIRTLNELSEDAEFREAAHGALLWLMEIDLPGKAVRVNITLEESVLKRIDRAARAAGETRSAYLANAAVGRMREAAKA